jgi:D-alanyl-D-alanine carboxypeptidase (penicillin-binding protein 5/6)
MNAHCTEARSRRPTRALLVALASGFASLGATAHAFETTAPFAILLDVGTQSTLLEKEADAPMPPASLAKLMTAAVVFREIEEGRIDLEDKFLISEHAWRTGGAVAGGSTMFAEVGSSVPVADLLRGLIVQSGNDAAIALAEGIAGTEAAFAETMNAYADELGLTGSTFVNPSGLPAEGQAVTVRDLARLAEHLVTEFPDLYAIYSETAFTWNGIRQNNRNPLLSMGIGADGLKTGFTEQSGYGLVGSAVQDGRRLIVVVAGLPSERARTEEARKLLEWGFRSFEMVELIGAGTIVGRAAVYGGAIATVAVATGDPVQALLPTPREGVAIEMAYRGPVVAPVLAGQEIGVLRIKLDGSVANETPLYAAEAVAAGTFMQRAGAAITDLLFGWW